MKEERVIRQCSVKFEKQCPKDWDSLAPAAEPRTKHCQTCDEFVYLCESDEETLYHAEQGHCIARSIPDWGELPLTVLGRPDAEWLLKNQPTPTQLEAQRKMQHEGAIASALHDRKYTTRRCQSCHYPFPSWYKTCRVCGETAFYEVSPEQKCTT